MRCKRLISEICAISMISIMISADIMKNNIYGASEEKIGGSSKFGSSLEIGSSSKFGSSLKIGNSNMFVIDGGTEGRDFTYEAGVLELISNTPMTIKNQNLGQSTTDRIVIRKNVNADITLAGVKIDVSGMENAAALKIEDDSSGNVTIRLAEGTTNILKSGKNCAGLQKNGGNESIGGLTIKGKGRLVATGGKYGAGIGGGILGTGLAITIIEGEVTAKGGICSKRRNMGSRNWRRRIGSRTSNNNKRGKSNSDRRRIWGRNWRRKKRNGN